MTNITAWIGSWNIGSYKKLDKDKFEIWTTNMNHSICVFGFQEVDNISNLRKKIVKFMNKKYNSNYKLLIKENAVCDKSITAKYSNFQIAQFIFVKKDISGILCNTDNCIIKECISSEGQNLQGLSRQLETKGFIANILTINKKNLIFVTCHLPFKGITETKNSYNIIKSCNYLGKYIYPGSDSSIIMLGDLNSRSLIQEIKLDLESTSFSNSEVIKTQLSLEEIKKKMKKYIETEKSKKTDTYYLDTNAKTHFDIWIKTLKELDTFDAPNINKNIIIRKLLSLDVLKFYLEKSKENKCNCDDLPFQGFEEATINFLPTYKRDSKSGNYNLTKDGSGRLPGYADRIIYKQGDLSLIPSSYIAYQEINNMIKGNDHTPISCSFEIIDTTKKYKKKRKVTKTRKLSKKKKKSRRKKKM